MEPDDLLCSRNARPQKGGIGSRQTILLARRAEEEMETDDLLCSRNARPQKDGKDSLAVLLLAERAQS